MNEKQFDVHHYIAKIEAVLAEMREALAVQTEQPRMYSRLVVTVNGKTFTGDNARETFADVIEEIGIDRVAGCTHGLIFESKPAAKSCRRRGSYYILVGTPISPVHAKAKKLLDIKDALGIVDMDVGTPPK